MRIRFGITAVLAAMFSVSAAAADWTAIQQPGKLAEILNTTRSSEGFLPSIDLNKIPNANPVGSGARAMGMGSAFIAIADDATAASWNPGALVNLERPEVSLVGHWVYTKRPVRSDDYPESNGENLARNADVNYASATFPTTIKGFNMVFGLNFSRQYNFYKNTDYNYKQVDVSDGFLTASDHVVRTESYDVSDNQQGYLSMVSPAYAIEITPWFSLGVAWNIWSDGIVTNNGWTDQFDSNRVDDRWVVDSGYIRRDVVTESFESEWETRLTKGHNFNLGFLWNPIQKLHLGGVLKTPFTADIRVKEVDHMDGELYQATVRPPAGQSVNFNGANDWNNYTVIQESRTPYTSDRSETFHDQIEFPLIYGLGAAWRFNDAFTLSFSWMRTHWEDFKYIYDKKRGRANNKEPFVSGNDLGPGDTFRLGAEYLFIFDDFIIPARAGAFYDPEPGRDGLDDFYGVTVGTGYIFERASFDFAYQYKWGYDIGDALNVPGAEEDHKQHKVMASVIWYF